MLQTKTFPTPVVLSLLTGYTLCLFGDMHELAEFLSGQAIEPHKLVNASLWKLLKDEILEQHPQLKVLPVLEVTRSNWKTVRDHLVFLYGPDIALHPGSSRMLNATTLLFKPRNTPEA